MYYCYIVECSDGTLYTGSTNNLEKRINTHNAGKGAKYTRERLPVKLVYWEEFESKNECWAREFWIKRRTRHFKLKLVEEFQKKLKKDEVFD